jgi:hypothetical protein
VAVVVVVVVVVEVVVVVVVVAVATDEVKAPNTPLSGATKARPCRGPDKTGVWLFRKVKLGSIVILIGAATVPERVAMNTTMIHATCV